MTRRLKDKLLDELSVGNRPIRIFFFGGALLAYFTMKILGKILGIETDSGGDVGLFNAILMTMSILIGFAASYGLCAFWRISGVIAQRTGDDNYYGQRRILVWPLLQAYEHSVTPIYLPARPVHRLTCPPCLDSQQ